MIFTSHLQSSKASLLKKNAHSKFACKHLDKSEQTYIQQGDNAHNVEDLKTIGSEKQVQI